MTARRKILDISPPKKFREKKAERPKEPSKKILSKGPIFIFFFLILVGIVIGYFALAKVEIEIWPETEILNFEKKITATIETSQINPSQGILPATFFEVEERASQEFPASGKVQKKAEGTIRVYNNYHLLVTLRAGTRFQPSTEEVLYFCSPQKITIPAKRYVDIKVIACRPGEGEKYNIGPSKFSVPGLQGTDLFFYIYGESFEPMRGGGQVSQVTQKDLEKAKEVLSEQLFAKLDDSLKNSLQSEALRLNNNAGDFVLLEGAIEKEILETFSGTEVGAEVSSFELLMRAKSKALVFKRSDLEEWAEQFILNQLSNEKRLHPESIRVDFVPQVIDLESGKIVLNLKFSGKVYQDMNFSPLRENLKGKSLREAKIILENQIHIIKAQISAWPFWIRNIPRDAEKIEMKINLD